MTRNQGKLLESRNHRTMELLAPAGSFPAFEAALEQGADSVYVGAPGCNARALSRDFTFAEIGSMIRQAHGCGVKLYIAMNSLLKEDELPRVVEALACFEQLQPDALIIQDIGLLYLARTWFPDLVLHASTLLSVHNSTAARELTNLGFSRVVLARELTLDEIAEVHRQSGAEIEVFVHGAMCFSYSGLCMFSSLHGGKSSLRGQCVQPCRRHYSWLAATGKSAKKTSRSSRKYVFSMNDLCGVDVLPELRAAGVRCLKIEGRMKSASYVANTVAAYRMAIDSIDDSDVEQERILREAHTLLDAAMARNRSTGYMLSEQPGEAISPEQSGTSGRQLGKVRGMHQARGRNVSSSNTVRVTLLEPVRVGDRLRLHDDRSGERISFTLHILSVQGQDRKSAVAGESVLIGFKVPFAVKGRAAFQGSLYKVDVGTRLVAERSGQKRRQLLAGKRVSPDRQKIEQIVQHLRWKPAITGRRKTGKRSAGRHKKFKNAKYSNRRGTRRELPWWVYLANLSDHRQRLPVRAARIGLVLNRGNIGQLRQQGNKIKKIKGKIIWRLPPVVHEREQKWYCQQITTLVESGFRRFELGHCSQYGFFLPLFEKGVNLELHGQYTLNLLNSAALSAASHMGFTGVLFSLETEKDTLQAALANFSPKRRRSRFSAGDSLKVGLYVYGRPPLFTARLDSKHFQYSKNITSPKEEVYSLEHQDGLTSIRSALPFSLLRWHTEMADMGVEYLVLDLSGGDIRTESARVSTLLGGGKKRIAVLSGNYQGTLV